MSNHLTTIVSKSESPNEWLVHWRQGVQIQGIVKLAVKENVDDPEIVAELYALQWLLEHRSLFGVSQAGKGLALTVSCGAIKKLAKAAEKNIDLRESQLGKPHLFPYAMFLGTRFCGVQISVDKKSGWILPRAQNDVAELVVGAPLPSVIDVKGIGPSAMTAHAYEQFTKRNATLDRGETWRQLRRLMESGLRPASLSDERAENYRRRYGEGYRVMVHDETKWGFVISADVPLPKITTAYSVKQSVVG